MTTNFPEIWLYNLFSLSIIATGQHKLPSANKYIFDGACLEFTGLVAIGNLLALGG